MGRTYRLLTAAAVITSLGNSGAVIAAAFAVLHGGGDGTDVGLVAAARTVPLIAFLLVGGAVADRLPRHRVMVAANCLNCASQAVFATLVLTGSPPVWQLALLAALGGTGQAFFAPAAEGMLLSCVPSDQAGRAFAFFRIGVNGAGIGGAALGGALCAVVGPGWVLAGDAAAFALAAALRSALDTGALPPRKRRGGLAHDLREGWREVAGRRWLWVVVTQFAVVNAAFAATQSVYGPLVARDRLGGAGAWGTALATFGTGTLLGALLMTRWKPHRMLLTGGCGSLLCALPPAALAAGLPLPALAATMAGCGIGVEVFAVTWMTALHQEIPTDKLSRVSSYDWLGSVGMVPLATALAGPAQNLTGRPTALWSSATLITLLTLAALAVPDVRRLTRRTTDAPQEPAAADSSATGTLPVQGSRAAPPATCSS
ncbi:MFS transporter [Streptomyces catenulae]|uniref:MFS transporter n=1 Tax=Streptomyces catenulae TaxID=66875 RepID=A0ABV2Z3X7_9ACTN|nr:MFS transporter [Streptomyces catenulae]